MEKTFFTTTKVFLALLIACAIVLVTETVHDSDGNALDRNQNPEGNSYSSSNITLIRHTRQIYLRPVIIDGYNVAKEFGGGEYKKEGILRAIRYFIDYYRYAPRDILVVVPEDCRREIFQNYAESRQRPKIFGVPKMEEQMLDDDIFILEFAALLEGVIISNDKYREFPDFTPAQRDYFLDNQEWSVFLNLLQQNLNDQQCILDVGKWQEVLTNARYRNLRRPSDQEWNTFTNSREWRAYLEQRPRLEKIIKLRQSLIRFRRYMAQIFRSGQQGNNNRANDWDRRYNSYPGILQSWRNAIDRRRLSFEFDLQTRAFVFPDPLKTGNGIARDRDLAFEIIGRIRRPQENNNAPGISRNADHSTEIEEL